MAANKILEPTSCTTAEEAFKYPLPQVRQFHRSLTVDLDEKNARLRTLVGGSYRQLLGTAEMILQMRDDIEAVEDMMGEVGRGCGREVLGGMITGLGKLESVGRVSKSRETMRWVAVMKVLCMCGVVIGRLLRRGVEKEGEFEGKGKNLVLAAKVWILGRLLSKNVGESANGALKGQQEIVQDARRKLASTQRRLRRVVERTLESLNGGEDKEDLAHVLCAQSLITSSGARDILRYFLTVRARALTLSMEDAQETKQNHSGIMTALELYTKTLLDVQALAPRRLSEALSRLKANPLLSDSSLCQLEGLRLDICEKWAGDEILFFTPYIRHDDLEGSEAVEMLKEWAKKASMVFLEGFSNKLRSMSDVKTVVELRTRIIELWIKEGGKARGFDPSLLRDGLRQVINDRMAQLLESRGTKLHLVGTEMEATLGAWQAGITGRTGRLWDEVMLETNISNGASLFKQGVLARTYGRNDAVSRAINGYETWRHLIEEIFLVLDQLRQQKWDDNLDDLEDEVDLESWNELLSRDDPQVLQERLHESLEKAFANLHEKISLLWKTYEEVPHSGQIAIYMLRIIRDIRSKLPKKPSVRTFGLSSVPSLHQKLASNVSDDAIAKFSNHFKRKKLAGRALWEGSPEIPVQPSPSTFKFLYDLGIAMAEAGGDLWDTGALKAIKIYQCSNLGRGWAVALESPGEKEPLVNGTATNRDIRDDDSEPKPDPEVSKTRKNVLIQSLFDIYMLQCAYSQPDTWDELQDLGKSVESRLELEASYQKRLLQGAQEYWRRTNLLFGPLA